MSRLFVERLDPSNARVAVRRHHLRCLNETLLGRPLLLPQKQTTFEIPALLVVDARRDDTEGVSVLVLSQPLLWE